MTINSFYILHNYIDNEQRFPVCTLLSLIQVKLKSYTLRDKQYEKDKDWNDVKHLIIINTLPRQYLDHISSQKKIILYQMIYDRELLQIHSINGTNINYLFAESLDDRYMIEEMMISQNESQPDDFSGEYFSDDYLYPKYSSDDDDS